jgi:xanthine dehydrogenase molybdenum-binding subunit
VHEVFQTQRIEHAFLEPESTVAVPVDGDTRLHVYSGGQGVWDDRNDIARVLAIPPADITVELVSNGGAFGGKEDMANQAQTALAAWLLKWPVKCTLSREESLLIHPSATDPHGVLGWVRRRRQADRPQVRAVGDRAPTPASA